MRSSFIVVIGFATGCIRPEPAQPMQPYPYQYTQPYPYQQQPYPQQQQPYPQQQQPYPQQQQQPQQPPQQQANQAPPPQPQPQQPQQPPTQPQQPYAPYPPRPMYRPYGYAYPPPNALPPPPTTNLHWHDGEVIGDFATVGALASIDLLVRQDVRNGTAGTFILLAGLTGGGALGWVLTDQFPVDSGSAHATTLGLAVGIANGALLIEPTKWDDADQVLGLLLLGSAIGAGGGFAYGQLAHLTSGQSYFVANMTLLGSATAAFGAIVGSRDGEFGGREDAALAIGLDGGVLGGAVIAPMLDWSARRAKIVMSSTLIGAFVGGMITGLVTKQQHDSSSSSDDNGDLVASFMTAGMWGGFGLGILVTRDDAPDVSFSRPAQTAGPSTNTSFAPWIGRDGQYGVMAGGTF